MAEMKTTASNLIDAIKEAGEKKTSGYDTAAEVRRIEGGTAWVHIPGGVDETPVQLTVNAAVGDTVQLRVSGGSAWIVGNKTAPPTDDTTANVARTVAVEAKETADGVSEIAEAAQASAATAASAAAQAVLDASTAQTAANTAQSSADSALVSLATVEDVVGVLNWITAHGTMTLTTDVTINPAHVYFVIDPAGDYEVGGIHYSVVAEPTVDDIGTYYNLSVDESVQNYMVTHVAVNSEGLWLIPEQNGTPASNGKQILIATGAGSTYTTAGTYIIDRSGGTDTVMASFRANGATIGENANGKSRSEIGTSGMQIIQNVSGVDTAIANLGYGPGTDSGGGTSDAPYYTLGTRRSGSTIGNYSVASGYRAEASGYGSFCEGVNNTATQAYSHAEGYSTDSNGDGSHSEGIDTKATATGSHAQNWGTIADQNYQTAIGIANTANNSNNLFVIGNGYYSGGAFVRSDAFTVDRSGNVEAAGDIEDGSGNVLSNKADTSSIPTVQHGSTGTISVNASAYTDKAITFTPAFTNTPAISATFWTNSTSGTFGRCTLSVVSVSNTGATIRVFNGDSSSRSPNVLWMAIGI